jgi:hypothetical protein
VPELAEQSISCPYCAETISVLIDDSLAEQQYVEDCQVCCRPIVFDITAGNNGDMLVSVRVENE